MTTIALGHVMDITEKRPASFINTAEDAAAILFADSNKATALAIAVRRAVRDIRATRPHLAPYLSHPSIIMGIANGRCDPATMLRWLEELEAIDGDEGETTLDEGDTEP